MTFGFPRMSWNEVVTMAADVARNGFNVTYDLGNYCVLCYIKPWVKSLSKCHCFRD